MSSKQDIGNTFTRESGEIHLGGIDALVRLTLDQVRTDARRGLKTGMFVSGYRGSPVGMLDAALIKQQKLLLEHHIKFVDGLNEDLAATAVWGTQMMHTVGKQKFDGVTGMWYGKAPGVDRSGDALKHANYTGIGKNGGVLAIVGDDPSCKSSSLCSQSEPMLFHVGIPSLYPANVQEILDYGLHGYNMSRNAGVWVGMKIVTNVADGTGTASVDPSRLNFVTPDMMFDGQKFTPNMNLGMNVRVEALEMEQSLYTRRLEVAKRFGATDLVNSADGKAADTVKTLTEGRGVDTAIEAVGIPATFGICENIVAAGGIIANVGVHGTKVDLHLETLWAHNISITTRLVDTATTGMLLKTVQSKALDPSVLITHRFTLDQALDAYETFAGAAKSKALKVIIAA